MDAIQTTIHLLTSKKSQLEKDQLALEKLYRILKDSSLPATKDKLTSSYLEKVISKVSPTPHHGDYSNEKVSLTFRVRNKTALQRIRRVLSKKLDIKFQGSINIVGDRYVGHWKDIGINLLFLSRDRYWKP